MKVYPLICPVGPMAVENMRLNSMGSDRSLLVRGDFMLYFTIVLPMSSLDMPSIWRIKIKVLKVLNTESTENDQNQSTERDQKYCTENP